MTLFEISNAIQRGQAAAHATGRRRLEQLTIPISLTDLLDLSEEARRLRGVKTEPGGQPLYVRGVEVHLELVCEGCKPTPVALRL